MKLSIIIPVFNEEKTIGEILKKVSKIEIPNVEKQIIVVNDGSTDGTNKAIKNLPTVNPGIKIINHSVNQGKGAAVRTGIKDATGDYIIIQDADLEYNPKDISKLTKLIGNGELKVVFGTRLNRLPNLSRDEKRPLFLLHYFGNRLLSLFTSILYGQWITDMETCYKLFPRKVIDDMKLNARGFDFEPEITAKILKKGIQIIEAPIKTNPRGYNEGKKLNTIRDGTIALWTLLKYRFRD